jgi:hypothetical protein
MLQVNIAAPAIEKKPTASHERLLVTPILRELARQTSCTTQVQQGRTHTDEACVLINFLLQSLGVRNPLMRPLRTLMAKWRYFQSNFRRSPLFWVGQATPVGSLLPRKAQGGGGGERAERDGGERHAA